MSDYTFAQLVNLAQIRNLLESHNTISGMAYGLSDDEENNLIAVGWQDICVRFHRTNPASCARCRESDAYIKMHLHDFGEDGLEYRCKNGMIDVAIPIVIDGRHCATFFTGQFIYEDERPDMTFYIEQAAELGFDREEYLHALELVPVFSRAYIRANMRFLSSMVKMLAETGFANLKLAREAKERKQIQNDLIKAQKLESLGVLAGGIAHDFSNILVEVSGNISLAMKRLATDSSTMKCLSQADKAAQRATRLVRRLTAFSKGGASARIRVNLRNIVEDSVAMALRGTFTHGEIHMSDSIHYIEADEVQLLQVFSNLAINAVQAMPDGGTLRVYGDNASDDECAQRGLPTGTYVKVEFSDEGNGISEEDQKRIFVPFFTTKTDGSGLGLASSQLIVTKHDGQIFVSSTFGHGTTFTVYLPSKARTINKQANMIG